MLHMNLLPLVFDFIDHHPSPEAANTASLHASKRRQQLISSSTNASSSRDAEPALVNDDDHDLAEAIALSLQQSSDSTFTPDVALIKTVNSQSVERVTNHAVSTSAASESPPASYSGFSVEQVYSLFCFPTSPSSSMDISRP